MKLIIKYKIVFIVICGIVSSCSSNVSKTTGWAINDMESGGFFSNLDFEQEVGNGLVFIPGGTFVMGNSAYDIMGDYNVKRSRQHVSSFYMDEEEVTNIAYMEYLHWLKRVFPSENEQYKFIYSSALPDSLVWREKLSYNEVLVYNYLRHPAYSNYPVVGVSWVQANNYCKWRTDRVNERILIDKGVIKNVHGLQDKIIEGTNHFDTDVYLDNPENVFEDKSSSVYGSGLPSYLSGNENKGEFEGRHVQIEDGLLLPNYRLPTEVEWEYAALGVKGSRIYNNIKSRRIIDISNKKILANFKRGRGDYSGLAGWTNDGADITAPVRSYPPNDFGLYDMAGNVSEWVADIYRDGMSFFDFDFRYYRGNVFKKNKLNKEGNAVLVTEENMEYDTLVNGRIVPKNLPGKLVRENVGLVDVYMRTNYDKSDNRDFSNGDNKSLNFYNNVNGKNRMYDSPESKFKNKNGKLVGVYDKKFRTTLLNNKSRVYKGGSWNDRIHWLEPAQRRFLNQDLSSASIGFRCAMDRLGTINKGSNTRTD